MIIGEFSRLTGISAYTLRYYEKKGLLHVERDGAGRRDYREADVEWVKFIKRLKDTGMLLRDGGPLSLQIKRKIRKFLFPRESDDHLRSSAFHAVNLDGSTHSRNGMFYDRQSESRTVHHLAVTFIYPEKSLEYAIPVFIRDPDPGIFYNQFRAFPQIVYGNGHRTIFLIVFYRVFT